MEGGFTVQAIRIGSLNVPCFESGLNQRGWLASIDKIRPNAEDFKHPSQDILRLTFMANSSRGPEAPEVFATRPAASCGDLIKVLSHEAHPKLHADIVDRGATTMLRMWALSKAVNLSQRFMPS